MNGTPTPSKTQEVAAAFDNIPRHKKKKMYLRTLVGVSFIFTGIAMANGWMFCNKDGCLPLKWAFATFGAGWLVVSGQIIFHPIKLAIARYSDFVRAKKGEPINSDEHQTTENETQQ